MNTQRGRLTEKDHTSRMNGAERKSFAACPPPPDQFTRLVRVPSFTPLRCISSATARSRQGPHAVNENGCGSQAAGISSIFCIFVRSFDFLNLAEPQQQWADKQPFAYKSPRLEANSPSAAYPHCHATGRLFTKFDRMAEYSHIY